MRILAAPEDLPESRRDSQESPVRTQKRHSLALIHRAGVDHDGDVMAAARGTTGSRDAQLGFKSGF